MKFVFENGLTLIYNHKVGELTSFCIGFNAGALIENNDNYGVAHAVEHMLFKATKTKSEFEINKLCDETFGFHNAMTNFPYAIYYGTTLSKDFNKGINIYGDIILNPIFPLDGFQEEINIILEELKEWKDDPYQYCEDSLLFNAFKERRIKNIIIGTEQSIRSIKLDNIRQYYKRFYGAKNCVISVVSSLNFELVFEVIKNCFEGWDNDITRVYSEVGERNIRGMFEIKREGIKGAKIQYCFSIDELNKEELKALYLFNLCFGEGTSCVLYDEIRTKNALAYEVYSNIKNERGIKLFNIVMGTSGENIEQAIKLTNNCIQTIKVCNNYFSRERIEAAAKSFKLKRALKNERSIELAKTITTFELMYGDYNIMFEETEDLNLITEIDILNVINKVLVNPTIQIIRPK